jgi:hypothetical protein
MREKLKLTDVQIKLALVVIFIVAYFLAMPYPEKSRAFPQLISVVSLIFVVISLVFDFRKKEVVSVQLTDIDDDEVKVLSSEEKKARKQRFYKAWVIIIFSTLMGFLGGFLFSAFFFFLGFAAVFGERKMLVKNIIITVIMTVITYVVFEVIMAVPMLEGILW